MIAMMLASSPRELRQISLCGRCLRSGPWPFSGRSTLCSWTNTHWFVAPMENRGVVIVPDPRIIHHVFEIANDLGSGKVVSPCWNERLMHVQCNRERAINPAKIDATFG